MKSHPTVDQKPTRSQKICMVTPAPTYSRKGNRVTALRWARILRQLGHQVTVQQSYQRLKCDLMIALHARRSHESMVRFRQRYANLPLILALTGTDLYGDIHSDESAQLSLDMADMRNGLSIKTFYDDLDSRMSRISFSNFILFFHIFLYF